MEQSTPRRSANRGIRQLFWVLFVLTLAVIGVTAGAAIDWMRQSLATAHGTRQHISALLSSIHSMPRILWVGVGLAVVLGGLASLVEQTGLDPLQRSDDESPGASDE